MPSNLNIRCGIRLQFKQVRLAIFSTVPVFFSSQEFVDICSILAAILNIGDIKIEEDDASVSYLGEVSVIANRDVVNNGRSNCNY